MVHIYLLSPSFVSGRILKELGNWSKKDDPTPPDDSGKVSKPNGVVGGSISGREIV